MRQTGRRLQVGIGFVLTVVALGVVGVSAQNGGLEVMQGQQGLYDEELYQFYGNGARHPRSILRDFAVDRMLKDRGFVRSIMNCVLDKGPCESNGRKLRLMAPEILRGQCPGCSRTMHNQIRKVISHVQRNFPVEWSEVTRRFMSYTPGGGQDYAPQPAYSPPQPAYSPPQPAYHPAQAPPPPAYSPAVQQQPPPQSSFEHQQHQHQQSQHQQSQSQQPQQQYNPNADPNVYQNYG